MSQTPGHDDSCGCWSCEDSRRFDGVETIRDKEARLEQENQPATSCICTDPYAAYHSYACRNQHELNKPKFYVASRASNPARPAMWREFRDKHKVKIISTWIDETAPDYSKLWCRIDAEIARCDCVVLYVEADDFPLKGAFVEVGMAIARGKPVIVVAPGIDLDPFDCKPLGSWAKHPLVKFKPSLEKAFASVHKYGDSVQVL